MRLFSPLFTHRALVQRTRSWKCKIVLRTTPEVLRSTFGVARSTFLQLQSAAQTRPANPFWSPKSSARESQSCAHHSELINSIFLAGPAQDASVFTSCRTSCPRGEDKVVEVQNSAAHDSKSAAQHFWSGAQRFFAAPKFGTNTACKSILVSKK